MYIFCSSLPLDLVSLPTAFLLVYLIRQKFIPRSHITLRKSWLKIDKMESPRPSKNQFHTHVLQSRPDPTLVSHCAIVIVHNEFFQLIGIPAQFTW